MAEVSSRGADAFARRAWSEVRDTLGDAADPTAADLERLAIASYLEGADDDAVSAWDRAHQRHLESGERARAAECTFWAALCLMLRGQQAHAGGWLSRTEKLVGDVDCAAAGLLLIPAMLGALEHGDAASALDLAVRAGEIADRCDAPDLKAFAMVGEGQARLAAGDEADGLARLDEVMLTVTSGGVGPIASGIVYCAVVLVCMQRFDLARASEWTAALEAWCASQPDLVPYRGQCLVHQSQLKQASGDWPGAATTVADARDRLTDPPHPALGLACYQEGELHRLRGELDEAAGAYLRASRAGYQPMPGLALLERARGDDEAAAASIRRALAESVPPFQRPPLLAAGVEVLLAIGDLEAARAAADELAATADGSSSPMLHAVAEHATGSVQLAAGDPAAALSHLRAASEVWQRLTLPYESARTATLLGRACLALADHSSAALELGRARETFRSLGAAVDLRRLDDAAGPVAAPSTSGDTVSSGGTLSARELEVLAQVAAGRTNREVADALSISHHTVRRHLENISAKLGVTGRAAAVAHAYEHGLL